MSRFTKDDGIRLLLPPLRALCALLQEQCSFSPRRRDAGLCRRAVEDVVPGWEFLWQDGRGGFTPTQSSAVLRFGYLLHRMREITRPHTRARLAELRRLAEQAREYLEVAARSPEDWRPKEPTSELFIVGPTAVGLLRAKETANP